MSYQFKPFIVEQLSNNLFDSVLSNQDLYNLFTVLEKTIDDNQDEIYSEHAAKYMRRMTYKESVGLGDADRRYICSYIICVLCKVYKNQK